MAESSSPLHRVIDASRWDAERLLGRLIMLVHAAFLDAGFVPHAHSVPAKSDRVPRRVGATASTLSLRYAAPQSQHLQDDAPVALRMRAHEMHVVFYVSVPRFAGDTRLVTHWACVDVRSAAPLLSGGLDDTARALTEHDGASLWRELSEKLSGRAFDNLCRVNALASLPHDVVLAILARLPDREDLKRLASTCAELRRLVAERDSEIRSQTTLVDDIDVMLEAIALLMSNARALDPTCSNYMLIRPTFSMLRFGRE